MRNKEIHSCCQELAKSSYWRRWINRAQQTDRHKESVVCTDFAGRNVGQYTSDMVYLNSNFNSFTHEEKEFILKNLRLSLGVI